MIDYFIIKVCTNLSRGKISESQESENSLDRLWSINRTHWGERYFKLPKQYFKNLLLLKMHTFLMKMTGFTPDGFIFSILLK